VTAAGLAALEGVADRGAATAPPVGGVADIKGLTAPLPLGCAAGLQCTLEPGTKKDMLIIE